MVINFALSSITFTSIGFATTAIVNEHVYRFIKGFNSNKFSSFSGLRLKQPDYVHPHEAALCSFCFMLIDFVAHEILKRALGKNLASSPKVVVTRVITATALTAFVCAGTKLSISPVGISTLIFTSLAIYYILLRILPEVTAGRLGVP